MPAPSGRTDHSGLAVDAVLNVVRYFERNGITAAGEQGYFQSVPLRRMRLDPQQSQATFTRSGRTQTLRWLQQIATQPQTGIPPEVTGDLVFIGSDNGASLDTAGKIVVSLNPVRLVPGAAQPPPPFNAAAVIVRHQTCRSHRPSPRPR